MSSQQCSLYSASPCLCQQLKKPVTPNQMHTARLDQSKSCLYIDDTTYRPLIWTSWHAQKPELGLHRCNVGVAALQSHFAQTKRELPAGTPHKELMSRLAADYKLHKESVQKQQQQQASPQAAQQLDLQPVWQQQQLDEALLGQSQLEVVELSDSEDEAGSGSRQQEQQQHDGQERLTDQEDVGGLLSFVQRLDLASTE